MDVQLSVVGQVVVDDQRNLRDVQASGPHVCRDQDPAETQEGRREGQVTRHHAARSDSGAHTVSARHLAPDLNSFMMDSLSFWGMSPCMEDTVKLASLIFSVSQSTWNTHVHGHRQRLAVMRSYATDLVRAGVAWSRARAHTHTPFFWCCRR